MNELRPEDDHLHPASADPAFQESMYVHAWDPSSSTGGFLRIANRPNEGRGELTICLVQPDGSVMFHYARPERSDNAAFEGGGLALSVVEPMRELHAVYDGEVSVVAEPRDLADPGSVLRASPTRRCAIDWTIRAEAPAFVEAYDVDGRPFASNHYEQLVRVSGSVDGHAFDGYGLRDHSWGPRLWQAPLYYRWLHGSSEGLGFMAAWFGQRSGEPSRGGFVWSGGDLHRCDEVQLSTVRDSDGYQQRVAVTLSGEGGSWSFDGSALATVPLRNRRPDETGELQTTRIVESVMGWTGCGRELTGMTEYLDQMTGGEPAGAHV